MKKRSLFRLASIFAAASLLLCAGCARKEPFPDPVFSSAVLYDAGNADPYGVTVCLQLMVPSSGLGLDYCIFNPRARFSVADGTAAAMDKASDSRIRGGTRQPELTGSAKEEFDRKIRAVTTAYWLFEDTELYLFSVSEGSEAEYAGQTVLCEACGDEVLYRTVPDVPAADGLYACWSGRIENVLYLPAACYDLTTHLIHAYARPSDLPPLCPDETLFWSKLTAGGVPLTELTGCEFLVNLMQTRVGNTLYLLYGSHTRYYDPNTGEYAGDTAVYLIYDLPSGQVLRAERFDCANLCMEEAFAAMTGSDGGLYTPRLPSLTLPNDP